ncbi:MAG: rhomboid family intramembrane serine protease [Lachnospiraceae bacterium]|nr:rhomboid family intramembrane serine protease [Lachnospiraceae bacterium]
MKKRIQYNSPIILTFALLSLGTLLLNTLTGGVTNALFFSVYRSSWANPLTYIRLFGHVLGHANLQHYVNNMMMLLLLGPIVEERYGSGRMFGMIAITAAVTGLINMVLFPGTALLGASGVVFLLIVLSSMVGFSQGRIPLTLILVMILYLGQEVYDGLFTKDNVSHLTHIVGGLCGCAFGFLTGRKETERT